MDARIRELRARAKRLADSAINAESMDDYRRMMDLSAKAEDEADELAAQLHDESAP